MELEHLKLESTSGAQINLDALYKICPACFTESRDEQTGEMKHVVHFETLRTLLGDDTVEDANEAYEFNWVGKQEARREVARPIKKTLRPVPEESVDWDNTENLYIEGDNLEVLKLLQKSYLGKVKMIYIDPPYNTGNDFVYDDDFSQSQAEYDEAAGNVDELGNRFRKNTDSNGKFHSDWCSMIYSRLMLARTLLSEDGVIFISIGDDEVANLTKLAEEVFGKKNFIASICHKSRASVSNDRIISENHNHLLFLAKNIDVVFANHKQIGEDPILNGFNKEDSRGFYKLAPVDGPGGAKKGNPHYEFMGVTGYWRYSKETMQKKYNEGLIEVTTNNLQQKYYLEDAKETRQTVTTWWDSDFLTSNGTRELISLMESKTFDNPKNIRLVLRTLKMMTHFDKNALVLDFFSGSATTAHAVMQLNAEDNGNRKFIMVQLPEETAEDSEAYKAGYKNICEIGKERIRRAGKKILDNVECKMQNVELKKQQKTLFDESKTNNSKFYIQHSKLDTGFRVLRLDESNMNEVYFTPKSYRQDQLDLFLDNVKNDRTDLDLLFGCMLDWGVQLSLPMAKETIDGCDIWTVNDGDMVACFSEKISQKVIETIADKAPLRVIFRDSSFSADDAKINIYETFKQKLDWTDDEVFKNIKVI